MGRPTKAKADGINSEIERLTGRKPTRQYNKKLNQAIQQNIVDMAKESKERHMTYGQLQAEKYAQRMREERLQKGGSVI